MERKHFIAFLVVGPGEGDRYLEQTLKQLWTDEICICLNNADEKTKEIACKYGTIIKEDNREWGKEQWRIKQEFLKDLAARCMIEGRDTWVWTLDADEIFDPRFTKEKAYELASGHDIAWYFWCLQLWNDDQHVRIDLSFPNVRFYKLTPDMPTGLEFQASALHCGLAPMYAYNYGSQSNLFFKHYGLMTFEDRQRKIARYDKYDPQAKYKGKTWYDALRNEKAHAPPIEEVVDRLPELIKKTKRVNPSMKKEHREIFMFRNKHGRPVPAVGIKQRDEFLMREGFSLMTTVHVNANPEAAVVEAPVVETTSMGELLDEMGVPKEVQEEMSSAPATQVKKKPKTPVKKVSSSPQPHSEQQPQSSDSADSATV